MADEKKNPTRDDVDAFNHAVMDFAKQYLQERGWQSELASDPNIQFLFVSKGSGDDGGAHVAGACTQGHAVGLGHAAMMTSVKRGSLLVLVEVGQAAMDVMHKAKDKLLQELGAPADGGDLESTANSLLKRFQQAALDEPKKAE